MASTTAVPNALVARIQALFPGARIERAEGLAADAEAGGETAKGIGYGRIVRVDFVTADGAARRVVLHTADADGFGHDRRSDRAGEMLLSFDTFGRIPRHVRAVDVGAIDRSGGLVSLADAGELYLLTEWIDGTIYAHDLRRIAKDAAASAEGLGAEDREADPKPQTFNQDVERAKALARLAAEIHAERGTDARCYVRAIRDLVGHGEGIFGIADSYAPDTPGAPRARIEAIQESALKWRFRLKTRTERLRRIHGDFHPFNILFDAAGAPWLLDTSRGSMGDPADDVACLMINYLFFGIELSRADWQRSLGVLWDAFWETYVAASGDVGIQEVVAPFFAWRALVVASPAWYPDLHGDHRDRILSFAERCLGADRFDPAWGKEALA